MQTVAELQQHITELAEVARYQPFGRDEGIRLLEARLDRLRCLVLAKDAEIDELQRRHAVALGELDAELAVLRARNDTLAREAAALRHSTSWLLTAPMRRAVGLFRR